tara:strand:- start:125 stop:340 length:216 start_codon:yes stop_codon:yes gene_type:complete
MSNDSAGRPCKLWHDDARHHLLRPQGPKEENTMGKGDIRTKRGKIIRGTYGKTRNRKVKTKYEDQVAKPQA